MSERKAIFCVWLLFCVLASASAETIVLKSGNAAIGERDPLITVVGKEVTIAGQEASAAVQPLEQALVVSALDATWATPAPGSCWVGVSQNAACNQGGYEYSTPIDLPLFYADPSFEITVTADNYYAVYLNGVLVGQQATAGLFTELFTHSITSDSAFRPGRNDLIIQVINRTDQPPTPTGLTFSATVTYTPDTTPPLDPTVTDDGPLTADPTQLQASWSSSDPESGIAEYQYAIGTSATDPGSGYVVDWKSAGTATEATETGLSLLPWQTYYWYVKAKNGAGLWSEVGTSDGVLLEPTARVPFREDFDTLDSAVWMSYANGGNISLSDGKLSLSAPGSPSTFPYLHLKVNPFPSTGDFTMRIRMKFNSLGGYGTGLQTTTAAPPNGPLAPDLNVTWGWWADVARSPGKDYHDVAWHYSNGQVTQSVDGVPSAAVETALPRCILLGNFWAVPGGYSWTSFEIDYIEVVPDDTTPPATPAVSDDGAVSASSSELHASWSSDDAESGIAEYLYAIGTSPTDSGSGYLVGWKSAGTATEATEAGLSLAPATTYFWYVKARNGVGLWSEVGVSDGIKVAGQVVMTPGAAKLLPDGTAVGLLGARVTATSAVMSGRVYVEDALRSSGIAALSSAEVTEGDVVNVAGLMATNADGERIISVATVVVTGHETPLAPVVTNLRCAASGPWFYQTASGLTVKGQRGVTDPPGEEMNTIGLLLQVHGVVMDMDGSFVFLNDGAWADRTGVRVLRANLPPEPTVGDYVRLTGISSMRKTSTAYQLVIRPRRSSDLEVIVPASEGLLQNSLWRALLKL